MTIKDHIGKTGAGAFELYVNNDLTVKVVVDKQEFKFSCALEAHTYCVLHAENNPSFWNAAYYLEDML